MQFDKIPEIAAKIADQAHADHFVEEILHRAAASRVLSPLIEAIQNDIGEGSNSSSRLKSAVPEVWNRVATLADANIPPKSLAELGFTAQNGAYRDDPDSAKRLFGELKTNGLRVYADAGDGLPGKHQIVMHMGSKWVAANEEGLFTGTSERGWSVKERPDSVQDFEEFMMSSRRETALPNGPRFVTGFASNVPIRDDWKDLKIDYPKSQFRSGEVDFSGGEPQLRAYHSQFGERTMPWSKVPSDIFSQQPADRRQFVLSHLFEQK